MKINIRWYYQMSAHIDPMIHHITILVYQPFKPLSNKYITHLKINIKKKYPHFTILTIIKTYKNM